MADKSKWKTPSIYGKRREGRWTPIRAKAQDTRANPNSWETHLVRKRWDIGLLRALSPRIMMMMMNAIYKFILAKPAVFITLIIFFAILCIVQYQRYKIIPSALPPPLLPPSSLYLLLLLYVPPVLPFFPSHPRHSHLYQFLFLLSALNSSKSYFSAHISLTSSSFFSPSPRPLSPLLLCCSASLSFSISVFCASFSALHLSPPFLLTLPPPPPFSSISFSLQSLFLLHLFFSSIIFFSSISFSPPLSVSFSALFPSSSSPFSVSISFSTTKLCSYFLLSLFIVFFALPPFSSLSFKPPLSVSS